MRDHRGIAARNRGSRTAPESFGNGPGSFPSGVIPVASKPLSPWSSWGATAPSPGRRRGSTTSSERWSASWSACARRLPREGPHRGRRCGHSPAAGSAARQMGPRSGPGGGRQRSVGCVAGGDTPRLAIVDWMMPGLDGVEICLRVRCRAAASALYIILLTARSERNDVVLALEAGADDYVTKPFRCRRARGPHPRRRARDGAPGRAGASRSSGGRRARPGARRLDLGEVGSGIRKGKVPTRKRITT